MKSALYTLAMILLVIIFSTQLQAEKITIFHIGDTHANLTPGGPRSDDLSAKIGGIARVVSYIGSQKDANSLFFHTGDLSIGDLMYCKNFTIPEMMVWKQLGCNAIALGNHEFDLNPDNLTQILQKANTLMGEPIPLLCANIQLDSPSVADLKKMVEPYKVFQVKGKKLGVFGLLTPFTNSLSQPAPASVLDVIPTIQRAGEITYILKEVEKCDFVICLSHLGLLYDQVISDNVPGINVIIGGHDHSLVDTNIIHSSGWITRIVQAGAFMEYVGKIEIDIDNSTTQFTLQRLDENIPEEPNTKAMVGQLIDDIENTYKQKFFTQQIGYCPKDLEEFAYDAVKWGYHDTPVGNLVSDAFKAWGKTDIAITATGFTSQKLFKGPIVAADIYRMLGYGFNETNALGYNMVTCEVKGSDLMKGIGYGLSQLFSSEDFLILPSGLAYSYSSNVNTSDPSKCTATPNAFYIGKSCTDPARTALDPNKYYTLTTNYGIYKFFQLLQIEVKNLVVDKNTTEFMVVTGYAAAMQNIVSSTVGRVVCKPFVVDESNVPETETNAKSVYPNPSTNNVNFNFLINEPGSYQMKVFNSQGMTVVNLPSETLSSGDHTMTLSTVELPAGVYNFVLTNGRTNITSRFLVVR